jgi:hypothetical protein
VLTYDGRESWRPPHPADEAMLAAFNAHQRTDKGFGPSAGPEAVMVMAQLFEKAGYRVGLGDSPWLLTPADKALAGPLTQGIAQAARETGLVSDNVISTWLDARKAAKDGLVGHLDLFAQPAGKR